MKNDKIWVKFTEEKRQRWIEINPKALNWNERGHWEDIDSVQRMHVGLAHRIERTYDRQTWRTNRKVIKLSDAEMIADGYQHLPRDFSGDVILRSNLVTGGMPTVQLPAEYEGACVRIDGCDLATMICEGHVIENVIRGPFRLIGHCNRRGSRATLILRS